jgi:hypothetical protein
LEAVRSAARPAKGELGLNFNGETGHGFFHARDGLNDPRHNISKVIEILGIDNRNGVVRAKSHIYFANLLHFAQLPHDIFDFASTDIDENVCFHACSYAESVV